MIQFWGQDRYKLTGFKAYPSSQTSPFLSSATYFGDQRPAYAPDYMNDASAQNDNFRVSQRSDLGCHKLVILAELYIKIRVPGVVCFQPGQVREGVADGHQRKLAL